MGSLSIASALSVSSQNKLGRNYQLVIQPPVVGSLLGVPLPTSQQALTFTGGPLPPGQPFTYVYPLTLEFDITRNLLTSANVSSIKLFNLSEIHRNQIRKDVSDYGTYMGIQLNAGYGSNLPIIFAGNVTQAWSVREGTSFVTTIESFDGGFAFSNGIFSQGFPGGAPQKSVVQGIVNNLQNYYVKPGVIGNEYVGQIPFAKGYDGSHVDLLSELTGGGFFIDNGVANCLGTDECLAGQLQVIDSSTGLLSTPVREQTILTFDMIFEPRLFLGQIVQLTSQTDANFNGLWKVISLKHRGTISQSVCGDAITSVGLFYSPALVVVNQA